MGPGHPADIRSRRPRATGCTRCDTDGSRERNRRRQHEQRSFPAASILIIVAMAYGACSHAAAPADCQVAENHRGVAGSPEHNKLIVDGTINGQKIGIVLDTGAERSFILRSAAARLGLILTTGQGFAAFRVGGARLRLKSHGLMSSGHRRGHAQELAVIVAGERDLGVMSPFFSGTISFVERMSSSMWSTVWSGFFQPKDCEGVSLAYWSTGGADQVEIEAVDEVHPQIVLTVQIDGRPFRALARFRRQHFPAGRAGCRSTWASRRKRREWLPQAVAASEWVQGRSIPGSGRSRASPSVRKQSTNPRIVVSDLWKDTTYTRTGSNLRTYVGLQPMLLGADFLRAHRVLIAHSQRKMYFTYEGGPMFLNRADP